MAKIVSLGIECTERFTKHLITFDVEFDEALTAREAEFEIHNNLSKASYIESALKEAIRTLMKSNDSSERTRAYKAAYNQAMDDAYDALKGIVGEVDKE